ncbi:unnamed protein product [Sphacelaria rigidula]
MSSTSTLIGVSVAAMMIVGAAERLSSNGLRGAPPLTIQKTGPVTGGRKLQSFVPSSQEYLSCFKDEYGDRVMEDRLISQDMTSSRCRTHCLQVDPGHKYYATQYGNECWCGKSETFVDYDRHGLGDCNMECAGDSSEPCGGEWAFSLFRLMDSEEPAEVEQPTTVSGGMQELFDMHNAVRCMHGSASLSYSAAVAATAASYAATITNAENCGKALVHSERDDRNNWGENLFMCGTTDLSYDCYSAGMAMFNLYDEEVSNRPPSQYIGHATQILWKDTKSVGCAVDSCIKDGWRYNYLVCNYDPTGNIGGQYEENVVAPMESRAACGYPEYVAGRRQ